MHLLGGIGVAHGVGLSIVAAANDADVVAIEGETVFDGHIGQIIHTHHTAHGNALGQFLVERLHGLFLIEEPAGVHLESQHSGDSAEQHSRKGAVAGDGQSRQLDKRHVGEEKPIGQSRTPKARASRIRSGAAYCR